MISYCVAESYIYLSTCITKIKHKVKKSDKRDNIIRIFVNMCFRHYIII